MRVLVVGASGVLGTAVGHRLTQAGHVPIGVSRSTLPPLDLRNPDSIRQAIQSLPPFEALMCTAGVTPFKSLSSLTYEDFAAGITDKLLGQIDLTMQVLNARPRCRSITLVSGFTATTPVPTGAVASTVNAGVEGFVRAMSSATQDLVRINAVSAGPFRETWNDLANYFPESSPVPVAEVASAFMRSLEGSETGQVITRA